LVGFVDFADDYYITIDPKSQRFKPMTIDPKNLRFEPMMTMHYYTTIDHKKRQRFEPTTTWTMHYTTTDPKI
jgi:predicted metalloprotease